MNAHNSRQHGTLPACATASACSVPRPRARRLPRLHPTLALTPVMPLSPAAADGALAGAHVPARV